MWGHRDVPLKRMWVERTSWRPHLGSTLTLHARYLGVLLVHYSGHENEVLYCRCVCEFCIKAGQRKSFNTCSLPNKQWNFSVENFSGPWIIWRYSSGWMTIQIQNGQVLFVKVILLPDCPTLSSTFHVDRRNGYWKQLSNSWAFQKDSPMSPFSNVTISNMYRPILQHATSRFCNSLQLYPVSSWWYFPLTQFCLRVLLWEP